MDVSDGNYLSGLLSVSGCSPDGHSGRGDLSFRTVALHGLVIVSTLTQETPEVEYRRMHTLNEAIDLFCSRGLAEKTRQDYRRLLHRFADTFPKYQYVQKIEEDDILRYLGTRRHLAKGTQAWEETVFSSFFDWLHKSRKIKTNPMVFVPRTRRPDPETLNLKRVSSREVGLMLEATETWSERLCLAILAYLGPRRGGAAKLRLSDYHEGKLRFFEKGGKTIWKRAPVELAELIDAAIEAKAIWAAPHDYLIPPEGPLKKDERDDRVIWRLVVKVAKRAGVDAHTHALRAAFADFCLDSDMDGKTLQLLLGHKSPATTERYTQRFDRERRMEAVGGLSWAGVIADNKEADRISQFAGKTLDESAVMGAGGFEPPLDESRGGNSAGSLRSLVDDLKPVKTRRLKA
jgi:integrase